MNNMKRNARSSMALLVLPLSLSVFVTRADAQNETVAINSATYICRPALASESASATMITSSTALVCRPFAVTVHADDGSLRTIGSVTAKPMLEPNFANALTPQQVSDVYNRWLERALDIDPQTRHTP